MKWPGNALGLCMAEITSAEVEEYELMDADILNDRL
jgi:hypothetical protein